MYQKDIVLDEVRKLALIIAKLLGLKTSNLEEARSFYQHALKTEFDFNEEDLLLPENDFEILLKKKSLSADRLDTLAKLIWYQLQPLNLTQDTLVKLNKVLVIFKVLEREHRRQTFDNIAIRNKANDFIKKFHE